MGEWRKVMELKVSDEIAVPRLEAMDSVAAFSDNRQASPEVFFSNAGDKILNNFQDFAYTQKMRPEENNPAFTRNRIPQDISEVSIPRNQYKGVLLDKVVDLSVTGSRFDITDVQRFMAPLLKYSSDTAGTVGINEEFHCGLGRLADQFLLISQKSGEKYAGADVFFGKGAKFPFNFSKAHSSSQGLQDNINRGARALNTGPAMLNFRVYLNMFINQFFINHLYHSPFAILEKAYHIVKSLSSLFVQKAEAAQLSHILWVKITSIEYVGEEHVYDRKR